MSRCWIRRFLSNNAAAASLHQSAFLANNAARRVPTFLLQPFKQDYIFNMWGVGEHVDGLNARNAVVLSENFEVASLCGRVAAHVNNAFRGCIHDGFHDIRMHAGSWWVGNDDIRTAVVAYEVIGEDVLDVASIEERVVELV